MSLPKPGDKLTFADGNATTSTGEVGMAEGLVNGPVIDLDGGEFMVPAFCERDNGREATTIFVHSKNVMAVNGVAWVTTS